MDLRVFSKFVIWMLVVTSANCFGQDNNKIFRLASKLCKRWLSSPMTKKNYFYCFEDKCKCSGPRADCSRNYGKLTFIPELPDEIRFLDLSFNNLTAVDRAEFFHNVTNILYLDMRNNKLRYIHPQAFSVFSQLKDLLLDYNDELCYSDIQPVFSVNTLQWINFKHGSLGPLPTDFFHTSSSPNLRCIMWHENDMRFLNFTDFKPLRNLTTLGLSWNKLSRVQPDYMPNLKQLLLAGNDISEFPTTCGPQEAAYFPRLEKLILYDNRLSSLTQKICLPNLSSLVLGKNRFTVFYTDMFSNQHFPSLVELHLDSMITGQPEIQRRAFNHTLLSIITMMKNEISFQKDRVHAESFEGCPVLTYLGLNDNEFRGVDDERFLQLFGNLRNLKSLFLGKSSILQVTPKTFASFKKLRTLYLYDNDLSALPDGVFDKNNLRDLKLSRNKLREISPLTFSESTLRKLKNLDISDNLFSCTCDLIWLRDWLVTKPSLIAASKGSYNCSDKENFTILSFHLPDQACLMSSDAYKLIVVCVGMVIFNLTILASLYRYRWHIRLVLYETFRNRSGERRRRLQDQVYNYDVFVSYAEGDLRWVQTRLMPEVEQRLGLRLCVHQRDFLAGKNIVDNIVDSVNDSKKILMVFSTNFARSHWCQFELAFCLRHALEKGDDLIVVCLEDILSRDLTSIMMAMLKTNTYIQWPDHPQGVSSFWRRLQLALQEILSLRVLEEPV
ncbi:hypothetical protein C0Q70_14699 [Pomacea canaliculata]|uniref:TIR domain-containing protein n=1 Tax=Pomacea canaliculata TaxID=400727 RepID=A0A2T7NSS0_POMCA|nr:hypothetical protein C0Q70_14699 [Pomacea canaliculata]